MAPSSQELEPPANPERFSFCDWLVYRAPSTAGFAQMVERAAGAAKLGFKVHPQMLRHACGSALPNDGHDTRTLQAYLGHKNISHVRYTELSPHRFKDFWRRSPLKGHTAVTVVRLHTAGFPDQPVNLPRLALQSEGRRA